MSNYPKPSSDFLNIQAIQMIDGLNLPIMQKHHLRILAHCLDILKATMSDNNSPSGEANLLKEWCNKESQKFNDQKFNDLLYEQLASVSTKLNSFSQRIGKNIKDLEISDLVELVQQSERH